MLEELKLKDIDHNMVERLKVKAHTRGLDLNTFVIEILKRAVSADVDIDGHQKEVYDDLDYLAGTWSDEEAEEFSKHTRSFNQIDEELWK